MWPLFVGIGVGFSLLLAYGWGMATGVKLGKSAQQREHEALRHAAQLALTAHEREAETWRALAGPHTREQIAKQAAQTQPGEREPATIAAAEIAHDRTRTAFLALSVVWGEPDSTLESTKKPGK